MLLFYIFDVFSVVFKENFKFYIEITIIFPFKGLILTKLDEVGSYIQESASSEEKRREREVRGWKGIWKWGKLLILVKID